MFTQWKSGGRRGFGAALAAITAVTLAVSLSPAGAAWADEEVPPAQSENGRSEQSTGEDLEPTGEGASEQQGEPLGGPTSAPDDGHDAHEVGPQADDDHTLTVDLAQSTDGTPNWDDLDDSATNRIVRTNDTITYSVHLVATGHHDGAQFELKLPQGVVLQNVPAYCAPGESTLTPAAGDMPDPERPLQLDSWTRLPQQTLVCGLGAQDNEDRIYDVTAKVRPEVPNGTVLAADLHATCSSGGDSSDRLSVTVASKPQYDLSKNSLMPFPADGSDNNDGLVISNQQECANHPGVICQRVLYGVTVSLPEGAKGVEPASSLKFVDDLRPEHFFGAGITDHPEWDDSFAPELVGLQSAASNCCWP